MVLNRPGQLQRTVLIDRHSPCFVQAHLVTVLHGTLSPGDASMASLLVTEFRFTPLKANRRIKSARIRMRFEVPPAGGPSSMDSDQVDVFGFAPCSEYAIMPDAKTKREGGGLSAELSVGGSAFGLKGVNFSASFEREVRTPELYLAGVGGSEWSVRHGGGAAGVQWHVTESAISQTGIPSFIRTAMLVRRKYNGQFLGFIEISTDVAGFSLRGIQSDNLKDDPVYFDPKLPPFGETSQFDADNLGSLDLEKLMEISFSSPMVEPEPERQARQELEALLDGPAHDLGPGPKPEDQIESLFVELWNLKGDGAEGEHEGDVVSPVNLDKTRFLETRSAAVIGSLGEQDLCKYFPWISKDTPTTTTNTTGRQPPSDHTWKGGFCSFITRRSENDGFTTFQKLNHLLDQPSINTMIDVFGLGESYALQRRHDRGTCQSLPPIKGDGGIHKRYIIQTPFYKKGFWSLVLHSKMEAENSYSTSKTCGILHADNHIELSNIFLLINMNATHYGHHPMLLPLRLFLSHFVTTSETFNSVLADIADIDRRILEELKNRSKHDEASKLHRDLSMTLHKCGMELAELGRRTKFEEQLADRLEKELQGDTKTEMGLLSLITSAASMSRSREMDIGELPGKIESLRNVLYSLITQHDTYLQSKLARESLSDSKAMKTLSILTILFLPGAFIATVFSTSMFEFEDSTHQMRIYLAITVPLTAVLMLGWAVWIRNTAGTIRVDDPEKGASGREVLDKKKRGLFGGFLKEKKRD